MTEPEFLDDVILNFAKKTPTKTAIIFNDRVLNYQHLVNRVDQLAQQLIRLGVGRNTFVAVLLEPSENITITLLAILRAGGIYAPMDPSHPDAQIVEKLTDIKPVLVITQEYLSGRVAAYGFDKLTLEQVANAPLDQHYNYPKRNATDPACIFFTSGSTGKAKGVLGNYGALSASIVQPSKHLGFTAADTLNSIARYAWSISMLELMAPLVAGGTSLILAQDKALDLSWLASQARKCTAFHCPPALLKNLADHLLSDPEQALLDNVRLTWYGGDKLPLHSIVAIHEAFPVATVATAYGATEIFGLSHCHFYTRDNLGDKVLIGQPVGDMGQVLIKQDGTAAQVGEISQLLLKGQRLASAYWQREDLTTEKFIERDGERHFVTGDYVKQGAQGDLEYVERLDNQVKVRGIRIELGEIEVYLSQQDAIKETAVVAKEDHNASGNKVLLGFISLHSGSDINMQSLRERLHTLMPDYMVPHTIYVLDQLPYTENFKIDRKKLMEYDPQIVDENTGSAMGVSDELSQLIYELWREAANITPNDEQANFFTSGGNSLSAILLASLMTKAVGANIEVADIYRNPSFAEQYHTLKSLNTHSADNSIESVDNIGVLAQVGLFFRELLEKRTASITCTRYISRSEGFDDTRLQVALYQLIERHKTLRTAIKPAKGNLLLEVLPTPAPGDIEIIRNTGLWHIDASSDNTDAKPLGKQAIKFKLTQAPLIKAIISQLDTGEELLQLTAHHIAADDNSMGRLATDLIAIYDALNKQQVPQLPDITTEYGEFISEQYHRVQQGYYEQAAKAIGERLDGLLDSVIAAPIIPQSANAGDTLFSITPIDANISRSLHFTDVVAAMSWAFNDCFGRADFVFCAHVALRKDTPQTPRVGMFVNLLPVFTGANSAHNAIEHAARMQHDFDQAMKQSDVPYELVIKSTERLRRLGRFPFDGFVNELRFEDQYPEGYNDVVVQRAFATDGQEISLSLIRSAHGDAIKLESPNLPDGQVLLEAIAQSILDFIHRLHSMRLPE